MKILLVALTVILFSMSAVAEQVAEKTEASKTNESGESGQSGGSAITYQQTQAVDISGEEVYNVLGEAIGDIDGVVQTVGGKKAIIGLFGSLKEVAVPLSELGWDDNKLTVGMLEIELEKMDDVDMIDFRELAPGEYVRNDFARFEKNTEKSAGN